MENKLIRIVVFTLLIATVIIVVPNSFETKAGSGNDVTIGLDYEYMWDININLSNIIHNESLYPPGSIPKGRDFGSVGDLWTADYLKGLMEKLDMENVGKDKIQNYSYRPNWKYAYKVNVTDFNLIINGIGYPFSPIIPKSEMFVQPSGVKNFILGSDDKNFSKMNYNNSFSNLEVIPMDLTQKISFTCSYANLSYDNINDYAEIMGNLTYVTIEDELPDDQEGRVFLLDEKEGVNNHLENISSNASGVILIRDCTNGCYNASTSNCNVSVVRVFKTSENLDTVLNLLESGTVLTVDNFDSDEIFTVSYNYNYNNWDWGEKDFFYVTPYGDMQYDISNWNLGLILLRNCRLLQNQGAMCRGIIAYDPLFDNAHLMDPTFRNWPGWGNTTAKQWYYYRIFKTPYMQIFCVNRSVGEWLEENGSEPTTSISGFISQIEEYVEAYNVMGEVNTDYSPDDKITVISNRYDAWWGECPGDSGAGAGIVLGIAKYIKEHNLKPKYNLTFLMTTGEEWGYRGAWYYADTHPWPWYTINRWIGTDQLGFKSPDPGTYAFLNPRVSDNGSTNKIIDYILDECDYTNRTGYTSQIYKSPCDGTDDMVWESRLINKPDIICIHKNAAPEWNEHHRAGENYSIGDSINEYYYDSNDINISFEFAWNVTKFYCFNPDTWFKDINYELWDSPDDDNNIPDSINISYTINTSFPHDNVAVEAHLSHLLQSYNERREYMITPENNIQDYINITLNKNSPVGEYLLRVFLYNSTGDIILNVFDSYRLWPGIFANDSYTGYFVLGCDNDAPNIASQVSTSTQGTINAGTAYSYSTYSEDINSDQIYYQFEWDDANVGEPMYSYWIGPYNSGESCTVTHTWTSNGDKTVRARARDNQFSPNQWSSWSEPLNLKVEPGCIIQDISLNVLVNTSFEAKSIPYSFEPVNWTWDWDANDGMGPTNFTQNAWHMYNECDNYTVNLTVKDNESNEYYYILDIQVLPLISDYIVNDGSVKPYETINFIDKSIGENTINNWTWDFDDGNLSYEQNTSHNYTLDGIYNVTLTIKDTENNIHSYSYDIIADSVSPDAIAVYHSTSEYPESMPFSYYTDTVGRGENVTIYVDFYDNLSGISNVKCNITRPDGSCCGNFTMTSNESNPRNYQYTFDDTWDIGRYSYTIWTVDGSDNCYCTGQRYFMVSHIFGYSSMGNLSQNINDRITGSVFTVNANGTADSISAYIQCNLTSAPKTKCMIYRQSDKTLIGTSEEHIENTGDEPKWVVYNFSDPKPNLTINTEYIITCWSNDTCHLFYDNVSSWQGIYRNYSYGTPPDPLLSSINEKRIYSIYCSYSTKPKITGYGFSTYAPIGFGYNVSISADVDDYGSGISGVYVNVSYPNNTNGNFSMNSTGNDTYGYVFDDTWIVGHYSYSIWAVDGLGGCNGSADLGEFNVSCMANVSICTIKNSYVNNETVNLTDPPGESSEIGYELLDDNKVLRIWNRFDSYYFNTSNGVQFSNHKDEYWSHNVLMLGYYNNDVWHLIYRTDELSGFNKNISSDGETFVNATIWKDLNYQGYSFRLAIRYHLGVDDNELTVIPYIKNLGQEIPYMLGFAWELKDIKIDNTPEGDYIEINGTSYYLNTSIDETYTGLIDPCYYIREDKTVDTSESLYLRWDENLNYKVQVKSRDGQYNAPVTLGIKIGTLGVDQEKYTSLFWYDASQITYYFNNYNTSETWAIFPWRMVDGNTSTYASTTVGSDVELCNSNTCDGSNLGYISKVELRTYGYYTGANHSIILRPVFSNNSYDGSNHTTKTGSSPSWSEWVDITNEIIGPSSGVWNWSNIKYLDCDVQSQSGSSFWTLYCSKVEMRVTYNRLPVISDPYPEDNSTGIPLTPVLNITVYDPDGDSISISWLSNSSGSWQVFGTNNSVVNGTYHQVFSNATMNGQWWYWRVNVSDGNSSSLSSVYKFYTGYQSKIENTGSETINGYLLIQVLFNDSGTWVVADNVVNETTIRTIDVGDELSLDTVFNPCMVNTSDLLCVNGSGDYRVYVCLRDPYYNVLVCDDDSLMEAIYEFMVSES